MMSNKLSRMLAGEYTTTDTFYSFVHFLLPYISVLLWLLLLLEATYSSSENGGRTKIANSSGGPKSVNHLLEVSTKRALLV